MARRNRSRRSNENKRLAIRFTGPAGPARETLLAAIALLIEDAGGSAERAHLVRGNGDLELALFVRLDEAGVAELKAWMADDD